ncbi:interleukin-15 receptor subunit alpha [Apus apus]|uniref:interleukin-15 receptor subunit alpha n=1 Tax=Apus apus TaxID=8895 RepID=UPI0021F8855A|nr:interleukin-15 receptor subunit alpha [Apus apus]
MGAFPFPIPCAQAPPSPPPSGWTRLSQHHPLAGSVPLQPKKVPHLPVRIFSPPLSFCRVPFPAPPSPARCSHPKDVANAQIEVGNNTLLHTHLRYTCKPGYKRKAGTSSLIQCVLPDGSKEPTWTHTTLQCIRDPALSRRSPSPELPDAPLSETVTRRGTTNTSPTSSPSPAATPRLPGPASLSPLPPALDGVSPETSTLPEMPPSLETSTPGEGTAPGTSLGTTPLPPTPMDHTAVPIQIVASSIGLLVVVVAGVVACCCWRMKMRAGQDYTVAATSIPMVAPAAENERLPLDVLPMG